MVILLKRTEQGQRDMTITTDLDTMFANAQKMGGLLQYDPNPYRTAYVRLIGELEAALLDAYRIGDEKTREGIESHLESIIRRQRAKIAKREENAK
jgi:hypothetical protein